MTTVTPINRHVAKLRNKFPNDFTATKCERTASVLADFADDIQSGVVAYFVERGTPPAKADDVLRKAHELAGTTPTTKAINPTDQSARAARAWNATVDAQHERDVQAWAAEEPLRGEELKSVAAGIREQLAAMKTFRVKR